MIIEIDLPVLLVNIADRFLLQPINTNEYVKFDIESERGIYPENIYFSAALSYKLEVVATK